MNRVVKIMEADLLALTRSSEDRIKELLEANNALLERARQAEAQRDELALRLVTPRIVGEGGSARPAPDPTAMREYGTDEDDREEGLLCAEDAISATMRERNMDFVTAVEYLAAQRGIRPVPARGPAEVVYFAEIDRLRAALAEKRR